VTGLALAWAFLTRIAGGVHPETDEDLGRAVPWFPWVGAIIGMAVWAVYGLATLLVPEALGAPLAILTGMALTGGLHEDGNRTYRTGDSIMEALNVSHNGSAEGDGQVRILVVNMGAAGVANTISDE